MENVKGYKQKILQKIHFQFCVGNRVKRMQVGIRKRMKFFWAVLKKNDDMNRPDVFVIEVLGVTVFDALVTSAPDNAASKSFLTAFSKKYLTQNTIRSGSASFYHSY